MAYLAALTLVAVGVRIVWIVLVPNTPVSDFESFYEFAKGFAAGQFPLGATYEGVGYPLVLSIAFRLGGAPDLLFGKIENVVLSTLTVVMCYYIFAKLAPRRSIFLIASTIIALFPAWIAYDNVMGTEVFYTFCLVTSIALLLSSLSWKLKYPFIGVMIGLATITKPYALVLPIVLGAMIWLVSKNIRDSARLVVISGAFMLLVIAPVTWMNYVQLHKFVLNSYNASYNLFVNNNDDNKVGTWIDPATIHISSQLRQELLDRGVVYPDLPIDDPKYATIDPLIMNTATHWIVTHPAEYLQLGVLRIHYMYFTQEWDVGWWTANGFNDTPIPGSRPWRMLLALADASFMMLNVAGLLFVALGAAASLRTLFKRGRRLPPWVAFPALLGAFYVVVFFCTEGQPRYAYPIEFMFAFCLAWLLTELGRIMSHLSRSGPPADSASVGIPQSTSV